MSKTTDAERLYNSYLERIQDTVRKYVELRDHSIHIEASGVAEVKQVVARLTQMKKELRLVMYYGS